MTYDTTTHPKIFLPSFLSEDGAQCPARIALLAPTKLRDLRNTRVLLEYPWWSRAESPRKLRYPGESRIRLITQCISLLVIGNICFME